MIILGLQGPDSGHPVKVDVPLVLLDIMVFDSAGRPVLELTPNDLIVYEDDVAQTIQTFTSVQNTYSVFVLVDEKSTGLMSFDSAIPLFTSKLQDKTRIAVGSFGPTPKIVVSWQDAASLKHQENAVILPMQTSSDLSEVRVDVAPLREVRVDVAPPREVKEASVFQGTGVQKDFYGALEWSIGQARTVDGRKGIVVFSDGVQPNTPKKAVTIAGARTQRLVDASEDGDFQKLLAIARRNAIPIYFIAIDTDLNPGDDFSPLRIPDQQQSRSRLELLAGTTGGRVIYPRNIQDVLAGYDEILRDLGSAYTIAYTPSNSTSDGTYHRIRVQPRDGSWQVLQSRSGYYR